MIASSQLSGGQGYILESAGYPAVYPPNQDQVIRLEVTSGMKIKLTFETFDLQSGMTVLYPDYQEEVILEDHQPHLYNRPYIVSTYVIMTLSKYPMDLSKRNIVGPAYQVPSSVLETR